MFTFTGTCSPRMAHIHVEQGVGWGIIGPNNIKKKVVASNFRIRHPSNLAQKKIIISYTATRTAQDKSEAGTLQN